ncbi:hypothetical protein JSY36_08485 [Bacillus sp. H-16]|uniref:hypothetical protein n=1 Tax=Alteribacter salitolerans TaxID=2912333 RepID=UPI00196453CF|nr:hypothetical protein [Alteribacter salitolerans]MBM7095789.1 hypothetical protein [Alteribacter salitolerans]
MMKTMWHEFSVDYYLHLYNHCSEDNHKKRSELIKKAAFHQDKLLKIMMTKHTGSVDKSEQPKVECNMTR